MTDVALIYPYFYKQAKDKSIFKFPPLGLGYLAACLENNNFNVEIVDGTFLTPKEVVERIQYLKPEITGFYIMVTMDTQAIRLAKEVKNYSKYIIAGGPYPSADPKYFIPYFDFVAIGEGEYSLLELVKAVNNNTEPMEVSGLAHARNGQILFSKPRNRIKELDKIRFPARHFFKNNNYINYWKKNYGYSSSSIITSRGCPFKCGFCSKPIFGDEYKERSAQNIVNEIEEILSYGYERVWIADDCFTLNKKRIISISKEIISRRLKFEWECLSRVDGIEPKILDFMKEAGCVRIFFGLESGNNHILKIMKKNITVSEEKRAVEITKKSNIKAGGFFILGYPGESNHTLIETVNFSSSLPLDYLSYTVPYPLPGTDLYQKVKDRLKNTTWETPKNHKLLFKSDFSEFKLKLAMVKGLVQHRLRSNRSKIGLYLEPFFRKITDFLVKLVR